ncbi:sensor histidine kinase [Candidatus Magnetaquicoccus inordinatus]|uniref:sensor histidine kinase n=1 Tax=Candidatus Magnetaquicoccus inordinatus TaxID=2496818 RepID=UPI00102BE252|nr:HAMP domain-containing sensor histidine kinase [Candidatus Magnetaquicoccus inordinatus]
MRRPRNLRFRVALAFAGFGAVVSTILGMVMLLTTHDLGQRLIDDILTAELDDFFARRSRNPASLPPKTVTLHGYVQKGPNEREDEIPHYLHGLTPGRHNLSVGTLTYRVAVATHQESRYFLLYDTTQQHKREQHFLFLFAAGVILITVVSALGGMWLVGIIIAPVTELARQVRNRQADSWPLQLAAHFPDDEVGELAHAFDLHLARLHSFMERERAFTADVSHELRTSLTVILSACEILLGDESLSERQRNRLQRIERAAHDMAEMGTTLLLMAREQHALSIGENSCLAEVINEAIEKFRFLLKSKPIQLSVNTDPQLYLAADRGLVYIAVSNIVRNAFAYTEQGEIVVMQDQCSLTVRDSGCGMRSQQMESLFLRHFHSSSYSKGSGIGLSLVKRICDHYRWTMQLSSRELCGAEVRIQFHSAPSNSAAGLSN